MTYKIAFVGMMGSGKTTIAKLLSKEIGVPFFDTDILFEKKYKISVLEFFNKFSQKKFREYETQLLEELLAKDEFIISTGGGIILSEQNRKMLYNKDIMTIYLSARANTIYNRIKDDKSRPLLRVENPKEEIKNILSDRIKYYSMATNTIVVDEKSVNEITEEIKCIL